ncbi:MAG: iron uptake porin, partial [Cyanobacteria bacterium J06628_3]
MRDISLLMASVLSTGQTVVPDLPEELPEEQSKVQQQLRQNQEASVVLSSEITPPEFVESEKNVEPASPECNYSDCNLDKQSPSSKSLSASQSQTVITLTEDKIQNQKILENSRNKLRFEDSFSLTQGTGSRERGVEEEDSTSEISISNTEKINSFSSQSNKLNQLDKQENIPKTTQKPDSSLGKQDNKLPQPDTFSSTRVFISNSNKLNDNQKTKNLSSTPFSKSENPMSQVTSVSELDDVSPTDWAFEALQSLANRHNCALGYPDGTFRGRQVINRYQFATGIDACLQKINELIATRGVNIVDEQDLVILQRLQNEFRAELNQLENRIVSLEERTSELQANRFSPTTRLFGQVTSSLQGTNTNEVDLFPRDGVPERTAETNLTFTNSMQITLATSFTGRDLLLTGLYAGNLGSSASSLFTNMGRLSFESDTDNDVLINDLSYRFAISDNLGFVVGAAGVNPTSTFRGINPLEGSGEGTISSFGQRNPIIGIGSGTGGAGFDWQINNRMSLQGVYSAQLPGFPGDNNVGGLFGGRQTL